MGLQIGGIKYIALAGAVLLSTAAWSKMYDYSDADPGARRALLEWIQKTQSPKQNLGKYSTIFYGTNILDPEKSRCGFGFDGTLNTRGRFYLFLGEVSTEDIHKKKPYVHRTIDIPFVNYESIGIQIEDKKVSLESSGLMDNSYRHYQLQIELDSYNRPIKAHGRVDYGRDSSSPVEIHCVFDNHLLFSRHVYPRSSDRPSINLESSISSVAI